MTKKYQMAAIPQDIKKFIKLLDDAMEFLVTPDFGKDEKFFKDFMRFEKEIEKLKKKYIKPAIKISSRKGKGRGCQNWVAKQISNLTGYVVGKDEMIAPREMGQSGVDVRLVADAKEAFPWSVECKWTESWSLPSFLKQARENQLPGTDWLLVLKKNSEDYIVVIDAEVFFDLLRLIPGKKKGR